MIEVVLEEPIFEIFLDGENSSSSTRDEEPLVNAWVNRSSRLILMLADRLKLVRGDLAVGVLDSQVGSRNFSSISLAGNESLPCLCTFTDNVSSILLVLAFTSESKLILWLSVWDLVDTEPLVCGAEKTREMALNILNIIQLSSQWIIDINDNDLPVSLFLIEESHDTKHLDLLYLSRVTNEFTDFTDIEWVIVALGLGLGVDDVWVLPGLREGTVVPEVSLVREAVSDKAKLALLGVLENWVELILLGDLHLCIGPAWDLNDHVKNGLLLIGVQWDIMEGRDWLTILGDEDTVLQGVWSANLVDAVCGRHGFIVI